MDQRPQYYKVSNLPKLIYKYQLSQNPRFFFADIDNLFLKFKRKCK